MTKFLSGMDQIKFYRTEDEFGFMSNFAPYPIFTDKMIWPTSEHYFQASKFSDPVIREKIRLIKSPMQAAEEGRKTTNPILKDWDSIKEEVMRKAIKSKFFQHPLIKTQLSKTGEKVIIEHTVNDSYWGDGGNGTGKNRLGALLMELRTTLLQVCPDPAWPLPPWMAFPEVDQHDMFWRMGMGENYMYIWVKWFNTQSKDTRTEYQIYYPANAEWEGFYD